MSEEERAQCQSAARVMEETRVAQAELARRLGEDTSSSSSASARFPTASPRATSRQTMQSLDFIRRQSVGVDLSVGSGGARSGLGSRGRSPASKFLSESSAQQEVLERMIQQSLRQSLSLTDAAEQMAAETRIAQAELRRWIAQEELPASTAAERRRRRAAAQAESKAVADAAQQQAALRASEAIQHLASARDGLVPPKSWGGGSPLKLKAAAALPEPERGPEPEPEPELERVMMPGTTSIRSTAQPRQRQRLRERQPPVRREHTLHVALAVAALKIQTIFRGFRARRETDRWWDIHIEEDAATRVQGAGCCLTLLIHAGLLTYSLCVAN